MGMEVQIFWGPNILDGVVDVEVIESYGVFAANSCCERQGDALVTITPLTNKKDKTQKCCNDEMYQANVISLLPPGVTSQHFVVRPVTSVGPMDKGYCTSEIDDTVEEGQTRPPSVSTATGGKASSMTSSSMKGQGQSQK